MPDIGHFALPARMRSAGSPRAHAAARLSSSSSASVARPQQGAAIDKNIASAEETAALARQEGGQAFGHRRRRHQRRSRSAAWPVSALTAVERESLENVPGNFSDDVGIIDHETGLHGEPTGFLVVDRLPQVDRGIAAIRRKPEGEINFALPAGARQPLGLAANRISPPSLLIARRMRAEAANRQVK